MSDQLKGKRISIPGQENMVGNRTQEQQTIDTLLASWKRLIEDNLFTQSHE